MKNLTQHSFIFLLLTLLVLLTACEKTINPSSNSISIDGLLPLLLRREDFDSKIKWRNELTFSGTRDQDPVNIASHAYIILDGELSDTSVYIQHDLECDKDLPLLEAPLRYGRPEINIHIPEYGDEALSFCSQSLKTQIKECTINTRYSNLISRLTIRVTNGLSDTKTLEELVDKALTLTNDRLKGIAPCK